MDKCDNCGIDPAEYIDAGELIEMPCGKRLCDDCRHEHHHCPACAQELSTPDHEYWG